MGQTGQRRAEIGLDEADASAGPQAGPQPAQHELHHRDVVQHGAAGDHVGAVQPRPEAGDIGQHRLEPRRPRPGQGGAGLRQQPFAGIDADQDAAGPQPAQDAPAEAARAAAELDHAVLRPQAQFIEQPLGNLREMGVLNLQPRCRRADWPRT